MYVTEAQCMCNACASTVSTARVGHRGRRGSLRLCHVCITVASSRSMDAVRGTMYVLGGTMYVTLWH